SWLLPILSSTRPAVEFRLICLRWLAGLIPKKSVGRLLVIEHCLGIVADTGRLDQTPVEGPSPLAGQLLGHLEALLAALVARGALSHRQLALRQILAADIHRL